MTWFLDSLKLDLEVLSRSSREAPCTASHARRRRTGRTTGALQMISPLERARLLDAEMQLQRAWLELNAARNVERGARVAVGKLCSR